MNPKTSFIMKLQKSKIHFGASGYDPLYFLYFVLCPSKVQSTKYKKYKFHPDNTHPYASLLFTAQRDSGDGTLKPERIRTNDK